MRVFLAMMFLAALAAPTQAAVNCGAFAAFSSCAAGLGATAGRTLGAAIRCGIPNDRTSALGAAVGHDIRRMARNDEDRRHAVAMLRETMARESASPSGDDCPRVRTLFADLERAFKTR